MGLPVYMTEAHVVTIDLARVPQDQRAPLLERIRAIIGESGYDVVPSPPIFAVIGNTAAETPEEGIARLLNHWPPLKPG